MALDHLTPGEIAGRTGLRVDEVKAEVARNPMERRQRLKEVQVHAH